jgi:cytoskeletal protein CcmA (bactofilin family)
MSLKSYSAISGSLTKVRAEQIKSEDALGTLAGDLAALRGQVADIIGAADYKEEVSGLDVQLLDLAHHIKADVAASEMEVLHDMKVDGAAHIVGAFTADAAALVKGAAEIVGAVKMNSSLALTGSADLKGTLAVAGLADFNGGITATEIKIDGDVAGRLYIVSGSGAMSDEAKLTFDGSKLSITGGIDASGEMKAGTIAMTGFSVDASGNMAAASVKDASLTAGRVVFAGTAGDLSDDADFAFASDVLTVKGSTFGENASIAGTFAVAGAADLNGALDVAGQVDLAAAGVATNVRGGLNVAQNLTVTGDLVINGTTTTVNSTTLTVDDKNIELGSVSSPSDATASGGGITLKGATDKTIIWTAAKGWEFSEKIEAPSAILNGDLAAVKGTFSGDVSGVKGTFSGDVSGVKGTFSGDLAAAKGTFSGDVVAPHVAANNLHQNYIVLSDAGHNLIDNSALTFDGALLAITGTLAVNGAGGTSGDFKVGGNAQIKGQLQAQSGSVLSGVVNLPARSGMKLLVTDAGKNVAETMLSYSDLGAGQVEIQVGSGSQMLHIDSGAKKLWSNSDLTLSASNGTLTFADKDQALKLANSTANWTDFRAAHAGFAAATSILDAFLSVDARLDSVVTTAAAAAKKSESMPSPAAANTAVSVTGPGAFTAAELTVDNSMVFFNGQLLRSGSASAIAAAQADYSLDGGYSAMKFSFAVEAGDVVVIQKI